MNNNYLHSFISVTKPTKFDKVVGRELCRITSKGTKVYSFIDGDTSTPQSAYLLSICEKVYNVVLQIDLNCGWKEYTLCHVVES